MADIANGTQFSDLPSCLVIEILVRLPIKALLICRYVRKDWTQLYFSDPYFIRRQLETSNTQFLNQKLTTEGKFRFGWFVDEVSTGKLQVETLDFSCNLPENENEWRVVNSCNGLLFLRPGDTWSHHANSSVCVCNPILGEWVCIPLPNRCFRALGFSAKNNQYKILLCMEIGEDYSNLKYEWEIYTLGTEHWRSIETKEDTNPWFDPDIHFNTFLHGSLHWTGGKGVLAFDFETERFTSFSLPEIESSHIEHMYVALGVINGCLWASFHNGWHRKDGEMWAMKEYGDDKSWTMMLAFRNDDRVYDPPDEVLKARYKELVICKDHICYHDLLFSLNGEEMLICDYCTTVICYNIKGTMRRRALADQYIGSVTAYKPSFVSLPDFERGEQVIRGRDLYDGLMKKLRDRARRLKNRKKRLKRKANRRKKMENQ